MDVEEGDNIIFMKVGIHAGEKLEDILERKRKEIEDEGFAMWGYGGNSCHPSRVQSFAEAAGGRIKLVMQEISSNHFADQVRASVFSADGGVSWQTVPPGINVLGSKFALCLRSIDDVEFSLDLSATRVPLGPSEGRAGNDYLRGHVDKACLAVVDEPSPRSPSAPVQISLSAPLVAPFAVLLRD